MCGASAAANTAVGGATGPAAFELPVIGEPFAVELANTWYDGDAGAVDVLGRTDLVRRWFAAAPSAADLAVPGQLTTTELVAVQGLRDACRTLIAPGRARSEQVAAAVAVLNGAARRASGAVRLEVGADGVFAARLLHRGSAVDVFLAAVAARIVDFVVSDDRSRVRRCERPGCPMWFVQHHGRRRFCHDDCSHRLRQRRYAGSGRHAPAAPARTEPTP